jgi:ribosomal protein L37AE/L43A
MTKKKLQCPKCNSKNIAKIIYGYCIGNEKFLKDIENGKFKLGGCTIGEDDPIWFCNNCHTDFGKRFVTLEELE